jgi:hypothetical protein
MPYCTNCGTTVDSDANFCGSCGTPRQPLLQPAMPCESYPLPPQIAPTQQIVLSLIIMSKDKRFGGTDYYTAVLTSQQMIFVPMTKDMVKQVTDINRQEAKGKLAAVQMYPYQQSYVAVPPATLITPTTLVVLNSVIQQIKLGLVDIFSDGYVVAQEYEVQIETGTGLHVFKMSKREENIAKLMQAYPGRVVRR